MTIYNRDEVFKATMEYFNNDELATNVWIGKYCLKDSSGNLYEKIPDDMHRRLAKEFARIETKFKNPLSEEEIYNTLKKFKYIVPGGGSMSGIGNNIQTVSLSNCFVIGNGADSYGGIMLTDQEQAQLMKRRGGVGHDLSHIRPNGMEVKNSALTSTGVVPFMERYSNTTREVAQDGRRGALMLSISVNHPNAEDFIDAKMIEGKITGANISVKLSDKFMNAAINNEEFDQQFPIKGTPLIKKQINAKKLWDKIIFNAWKRAEPGILFWDKIISESPSDCYGKEWETISTNPCGEIPMNSFSSCILIANNLYSFVKNPFTKEASFDFELFKNIVNICQRLADDIVELEIEKIEKILKKIELDIEDDEIKIIEKNLWLKIKNRIIEGRRTGVGVTSEGDMLAALGLIYGTEEATNFSELVHKTLAIESYKTSIQMAKERGCFTIWNLEKESANPFLNRIFNEIKLESNNIIEDYKKTGRRNIANLTCAPVGTGSLMTQTTSGIEPVFKPVYKRRRKINPNDKNVKINFTDKVGDTWEEYNVFHHKFIDWMIINKFIIDGIWTFDPNDDKILDNIIKQSPYYKASSNDVDWVEKVKLQGKVQKWIDHSVSVTVNLPEDIDKETVAEVYEEAWKAGCKGVTVYREGSRDGVLISKDKKSNNTTVDLMKRNGHIVYNGAPVRPKSLPCDIYNITAKGEKWVVLIGLLHEQPYEVFSFKQKSLMLSPKFEKGILTKEKGGVYNLEITDVITIKNILGLFERDEEESLTRVISLALRHGAEVKFVYDQLNKSEGSIASFNKAIGRALKKYIPNGTKIKNKCPECEEDSLVYENGCTQCKNPKCGYSKCG